MREETFLFSKHWYFRCSILGKLFSVDSSHHFPIGSLIECDFFCDRRMPPSADSLRACLRNSPELQKLKNLSGACWAMKDCDSEFLSSLFRLNSADCSWRFVCLSALLTPKCRAKVQASDFCSQPREEENKKGKITVSQSVSLSVCLSVSESVVGHRQSLLPRKYSYRKSCSSELRRGRLGSSRHRASGNPQLISNSFLRFSTSFFSQLEWKFSSKSHTRTHDH